MTQILFVRLDEYTAEVNSLQAQINNPDLLAIGALTGTGMLGRQSNGVWGLRSLIGTAAEITVTNGDGVAGAPTFSLPSALTFTGKTITGGAFVNPAFTNPALGTPASGVMTNVTGTAAGLTAGNVTTNANLTGPITSVGNATSVASQTGTGSKFVMDTSPTLAGTPLAPTAAVDTNTTQIATTAYMIGQAGSATPTMAGSAAVGTSLRFARQDHVHPTDTSRQAADPQLFSNVPINSQSAAYQLVLTDGATAILHPAADNNARTFTIPANGTVAFPVGTMVTFINMINTVTIAITTDTLTQVGTGATGSRTLAANGYATAHKISSTAWVISGVGLT